MDNSDTAQFIERFGRDDTSTTLTQRESRKLLKSRGASRLKPLTLALLKYLANVCYWNGSEGKQHNRDFPVSLATIRRNLGCSEATSLRHIEIAETMGLITVTRNESGRNSYALHLDDMDSWPTAKDTENQKKRKRKKDKAEYQKQYRKRQATEAENLYAEGFEAGKAAALRGDVSSTGVALPTQKTDPITKQ